ncbi:MAG: hypothetical protein WCK47_04315 [bacterium]
MPSAMQGMTGEMPDRLKPMSTGHYLLTFILLAIPFLNIVFLFVWSFSSATNANKQNMSRAILITMVISVIFWGVILYAAYRGLVAMPGLRLPI